MKAITILAASAAAALATVPANASTAPSTTDYQFTGLCADCGTEPSQATATLTLQNYTAGDPLDASNFVSFSYHSAIEDFTSTPGGAGSFEVYHGLSGSVAGGGKPYDVMFDEYVFVLGTNFTTRSDGTWSFSQNRIDEDHGTNGIWGTAASAVPEPGTWAMVIGGLGLVGGAMRAARRSDERFTRRLRTVASA